MAGARVGLVAFVAAAVCAAPRVAEPCSAPPPYSGPRLRTVYPLSSPEAPTNTQVRVTYDDVIDSPVVRDVSVRPVGGAPVDATTEFSYDWPTGVTVIVVPLEALAANTEYEVLDRVAVPCEFDGDAASCELADHAVVGTFRTGSGPDESPPQFSGLDRFETVGRQQCDDDGCCGPYSILTGEVGWQPASDATPPEQMRYEVFDAADRRLMTFVNWDRAAVAYCCSCDNPEAIEWSSELTVVGRDLYVRAVDLAGNTDGNRSVVTWGEPCVAGGNDAGPESGDDAGCGCAIPTRRGSTATWFWGLLIVLAIRRNRSTA